MNNTAQNKTAWSWMPWSSDYAPDGPVAQRLAARQADINAAVSAAEKTHSDKVNSEMTNAILGLGLLGVGAGLTGTKLYNIVSRFNKPKEKYKKFGPGPHGIDAEEKIANDFTKTVIDAISAIPTRISEAWNAGPAYNNLSENQKATVMPAALLTAGLGLYGGHSLAKMIEDKRQKEETAAELEDARKEYQRALTGKRAEALDTAFETYKKASTGQTKQALMEALTTAGDWMAAPMRAIPGLWPAYVTSVLGTGLLSGKMTYDWTRERGKDKALERARRSRARMEESSPLYIDPAQLEAIKALHQKEVDKIKQQEIA